MGKTEEREKEGKALPSSTRILLGLYNYLALFYCIFFLFSYLSHASIHTLTVKFQFLDDHCYPRPSLYATP